MTKRRRTRLAPLCALACGAAPALLSTHAAAIVGGASPAGEAGRALVLLVGSRGTSCSGVALARDLVLTAGHCVLPGADYKLVDFTDPRTPVLKETGAIVPHPMFDLTAVLRHRVTADVALVKFPTAIKVSPAPLAPADTPVHVGDQFVLAGYGLAIPGEGRSGGTARAATLVATGQPGSLQIRLVDPATKGERPGLGACTGDSGGPVFRRLGGTLAVAGVVSWSTGPKASAGCGGLTGVTPLARYRSWIVETATALGVPLPI